MKTWYRLIELSPEDAFYPHEVTRFSERMFLTQYDVVRYCTRRYWDYFRDELPKDTTMMCPGKFVLTDEKEPQHVDLKLPRFPFPKTWEDLLAFLLEQNFTMVDALKMLQYECTSSDPMTPYIFKVQQVSELPLASLTESS